jgi:iron complex transport system substrate-binding protein
VRIVSLLPSATEILGSLGLSEQVLGVTFECDVPEHIGDNRSILVRGLDTHGLTAAEIDTLVRQTAAAGGQMYTLDIDAFRACDPELVITQDLCRVCALPEGEVTTALEHLGCSAEVVSLDPHRLHEVLESILTVATAAGVPERGTAAVEDLRARLDQVAAAVAGLTPKRTFVLEWSDPPFLAGHWIPEQVSAAGGDPVLAVPGGRSVGTTWEKIAEADPDVILVAPCGFGLHEAATQAIEALVRLPPRAEVWAIDANGYTVRPGPRLVDGVEQMAALLHGVGELRDEVVRRVR